ncbi:hypothetical protein NDU88_005106 [Pleurodeles waltl]|uniref:Uncharacterized protein n=1 Tax=Pleurodeles waltl TaxID=8319 RepID=A0AAV7WWY3_PLEWA|nr:hypothetical protein NDU88_005106 [Pleurodeles waltl]
MIRSVVKHSRSTPAEGSHTLLRQQRTCMLEKQAPVSLIKQTQSGVRPTILCDWEAHNGLIRHVRRRAGTAIINYTSPYTCFSAMEETGPKCIYIVSRRKQKQLLRRANEQSGEGHTV